MYNCVNETWLLSIFFIEVCSLGCDWWEVIIGPGFIGLGPSTNVDPVVCRSLRWRHNGNDGVSNHQPPVCLLNRLFGLRSKKTSKLRVTGLCAGNSPGTGEFPAQMVSNTENISISWRHHVYGVTRAQLVNTPLTESHWRCFLVIELWWTGFQENRIGVVPLERCSHQFDFTNAYDKLPFDYLSAYWLCYLLAVYISSYLPLIAMTSQWATCHPKSPASWLFARPLLDISIHLWTGQHSSSMWFVAFLTLSHSLDWYRLIATRTV